MKSELENYQPQHPEFILSEEVREEFPLVLDFKGIPNENLQTKRDALKFVGKMFTATFPEGEYVTRKMDEFEKKNIREEYCQLVENQLPERKRQLEEAIEEAKRMKKDAEERYASALQEVATMAAEVKLGTVEVRLKSENTFCIALAGYYLTYTWSEPQQAFVLAKAYEIPDNSELFATDENNRNQMLELFGIEFAPMEVPAENEEVAEEVAEEPTDDGNEDF